MRRKGVNGRQGNVHEVESEESEEVNDEADCGLHEYHRDHEGTSSILPSVRLEESSSFPFVSYYRTRLERLPFRVGVTRQEKQFPVLMV